MARYLLLTFTFLLAGVAAIAQTSVQGKITDKETGEPIIFGNIVLYKGGVLITGTETDFDGNYNISNIDPGNYDVEVSFVGYNTQKVAGVVLYASKANKLDVQIGSGVDLKEVVVVDYKVPLIEQDNTTQGGTLTSDQIRQLPTKSINALAATTAGVASADEGSALNIRGSRSNATNYFLDGIRVFGSMIPEQDIEQLQVITGGVEARYGDLTGGIVSITTKGPSSHYSGGFELESSQLFDNYNYNLASVNLSGPILKNKKGESILGFRISGQFLNQRDDDPPATDIFKVKESKLRELEDTPIIQVGTAPLPAAEFLTDKDVDVMDYNPNEGSSRYDITGKLDARLSKAIDISVTGTYFKNNDQFTPGGWQLLNSQNNPTSHNLRYRTNVRLRHRLGVGTAASDSEDGRRARKGALIQNASYTLQFGFEKNKFDVADPRHGDRFFDYGYIGNFDIRWVPTLVPVTSIDSTGIFQTPGQVDFTRTLFSYTPNTDINPVLTKYVLNAEDASSFDEFVVRNGVIPSQFSSAFGQHTNVGTVYNLFQKTETDIFTFGANTSFDLLPGGSEKGRHSIQFGILYEQRKLRGYNINPRGLWTIGRLLANNHLEGQGLDSTNVINTIQAPRLNLLTGQVDTVDVPIFANNVATSEDAQFFRKVREVTGDPIEQFTNIDGLTPDQLSLDMFSAKELNDQAIVDYWGFDYLGNKQDGFSFNDFFSATDANGIRTFPVAALEPNYSAAYIQDKFTFHDIIFRLGVRVDRYDANTKVLKDPFALFDITTAKDFHSSLGTERPGTIGDDFKVYVTNDGSDNVQAYRDGDTWFFANGTQANDGSEVFGGTLVFPKYREEDVSKRNIQAVGFDPNISFDDYKPQVNWMPRLSFSFPISDEANFFAHYDILVQRPPSNTRATALTYFYFEERNGIRNNPNLKPERTVDYEVGFQQKLSNSSALKVSAYLKELRDMIQSRFFAFVPAPINTYETFDNLDFGTVKGFTLQYDMRRTGNVSLNIAYTLQFADGTGSDANTSRGITSRGIQRTLFPLSFDERNRFNVILDYRYGSGKRYNGPTWFGKDILANTGANLHVVAVSGRPYTAAIEPAAFGGTGTQGSLNGSRLPWNFTVNLQVDKSITLTKPGNAHPLDLNVYFRVSNLLDRKNTINVYRFTGSPSDDGFLASPRGQDSLAGAVNADHLAGQLASYQYRLTNPDNFSLPRRMYIGAIFAF